MELEALATVIVDAAVKVHRVLGPLTYLKLRGCRIGFLLNWNVRLMKLGIRRMVYQL